MKAFYLFIVLVLIVSGVACDRHSWEDTYDGEGNLVPGTKRLYKSHDHGAHSEDSHHGEEHDAPASHGGH